MPLPGISGGPHEFQPPVYSPQCSLLDPVSHDLCKGIDILQFGSIGACHFAHEAGKIIREKAGDGDFLRYIGEDGGAQGVFLHNASTLDGARASPFIDYFEEVHGRTHTCRPEKEV